MKKVILPFTLSSIAVMAASSVSATPFAQHEVSNRIINGKPAIAGDYPFMTALISANKDGISPFCGASYIGGRYILTAAHCIEGETAKKVDVWIGGHDTTKPETGKRYKVAQIYAHEGYDRANTDNDMAIIELYEEVKGVTPINLITPEIEATLKDGFEFTVMGWGNMNSDAQAPAEFPEILQQVNLPLYNRQQCKDDYAKYGNTINDNMMCAGFSEGEKDSCQGDSGGPLVFKHQDKWYQAGVVSFGMGCAQANAPGVYARVAKYNDWVSAKMSGVSYQQLVAPGFVEQNYDEQTTFNIKNVGEDDFMVTQVAVEQLTGLESAQVIKNACENQPLAYDQSCDITVQVKTHELGKGRFTLSVNTNDAKNKEAKMYFGVESLEESTLNMADIVESDNRFVSWYNGGDLKWEAQTDKKTKGASALASGDITHSQYSVLLAKITDERVKSISFKHLVSSEEGYDALTVLHNNQVVVKSSGTQATAFEDQSITLTKGVDRIAISYKKDPAESAGDDKAYFDDVRVTFDNKAPEAVVKTANLKVKAGESFALDASASKDADNDTLSFQWEVVKGEFTLTDATQAKMTLTVPKESKAMQLAFKVTVTDAFGATSSKVVNVDVVKKAKKSSGSQGFILLLMGLLLTTRKMKNLAV